MTATAVVRLTPSAGLFPARSTLGVAANVILLKGTMVSIDSGKRADVITNGQDIMGVAAATYDNRTAATGGAADAINAELDHGVFEFAYTGTAPTEGLVLFAVDNQTVSIDSDSGNRGIAGFASSNGVGGKVKVWISPVGSGSYADVAAVEAVADAAAEKADNLAIVEIPVPVNAFRLATGAAAPAFSNGVADGLNLADSEAFGLRWNDDTTTAFWNQVRLPADLDTGEAVEIHLVGARIGAADTTAVLTVTAFANRNAVAYDAGSDLSAGNTAAFADATKVVSNKSVALTGCAAGDVISFSVVPSVDLDGDDFILLGCYVKCTRTGA